MATSGMSLKHSLSFVPPAFVSALVSDWLESYSSVFSHIHARVREAGGTILTVEPPSTPRLVVT